MGDSVAELVRNFESGEIRLPLMQRDYVWPRRKVIRLLDSLYKQWPIGAFYIWRTSHDYPTKKQGGLVPTKSFGGFRGFLLDGQQRLTSLSYAVRTSTDGDLEYRAFFDLENERFFMGTSTKAVTRRIESNDPLLIPLCDLVLSDESEVKTIEGIIRRIKDATKCNSKKEEVYRERLHIVAKLYDCDALCEIFPNKPEQGAFDPEKMEQDAFELFSRLNKGGMSLSSGDVEGARLASSATKNIVDPMRAVAAEPGFKALGINFIFLLRCLVTVHRGSCSFSKLPKHWADDPKRIAASWNAAEKAIRATAELVRAELGWASRKWLPSTMALIPVVYMLSQHPKSTLSEDDKQNVLQYLLVSGIRGIFRGTTETTVNSYVNAIRKTETELAGCCVALLQRIPKNQQYKIRADEVRNSTAMNSPLMQLYLAMLVRSEAKSWPSGRLLSDVVTKPLPNDPIAVHHVFSLVRECKNRTCPLVK